MSADTEILALEPSRSGLRLVLALCCLVPSWLLAGGPTPPGSWPAHPADLVDDPLMPDPAYNGGRWRTDRFAGPASSDYVGRKTVRLNTGDTVTVGMVPPYQGANPANGRWNIGLVRHSATGASVPWTGNSPYHVFGRQYVIYPNSTAPVFSDVQDIKVINDRILVLANGRFPTQPESITFPYVLVFDTAGNFLSQNLVMNIVLDKWGVAMVPYVVSNIGGNITKVIVIGNMRLDFPDRTTPTLVRMTLQTDGTLVRDPGFDGTTPAIAIPGHRCQSNDPCSAEATSVQASMPFLGAAPARLYIGGGLRVNAQNKWNFMALAVDAGRNLQPAFGGDGVVSISFSAEPGHRAIARSMQLRSFFNSPTHELYLAGEVGRASQTRGVGVIRLGETGLLDPGFGTNGRLLYGGCASAGPACDVLREDVVVTGIAATVNRLALAGWTTVNAVCAPPCAPGRVTDPSVALATLNHGALVEFAEHPLRDAEGLRMGDAVATGLLQVPGQAALLVTGHGRDQASGDRLSFMIGRLGPDRLFGQGFEPAQ